MVADTNIQYSNIRGQYSGKTIAMQTAKQIGLNETAFEACLDSGKYKDKVSEQNQDAISSGGTGTPYNILVSDGEFIPVNGAQPYAAFKAQIDALLEN